MKKIIGDYFRKNPLLSPRGYQVETIEESLSLFTEKNFDALLIESPTGAGKTVMGIITAAILAKELGKSRIGWVAMRRNLLSQAMEAAEAFGLGELFHPISMFDKNPPLVDIVVVDEAHHDATVSMASMHKRIQPVKTLGLSATPMRTDRAELIFERTISKAGIYELVRQGFLARPDQYVISDWQVESVCSTFLAEPEKWGKSILFFFTMEECERARSILTASGVQVAIVHAGSDRERLLEDFESGQIKVLINMIILTEGFDCPDLETVFVRPSGKSLTQQMAGRVLRLASGVRKKIVQSQDSPAPFSGLAPIGRSFKKKPDGTWQALDYDAEVISRLISESNKKLHEQIGQISQRTHDVIQFFSAEKAGPASGRPRIPPLPGETPT